MPRRGVRILADDQHPHLGQRAGEGSQHLLPVGKVPAAGFRL